MIRNINASIIEICGFNLCLWIEQDDKQESVGAEITAAVSGML